MTLLQLQAVCVHMYKKTDKEICVYLPCYFSHIIATFVILVTSCCSGNRRFHLTAFVRIVAVTVSVALKDLAASAMTVRSSDLEL